MKSGYVSGLSADQNVTSFFLVQAKELRSTQEGKAYLRLELSDRTGTIEARMWEGAEQAAAEFSRDDVIKVQARVVSYRNKLQLSLEKLRRAKPDEIDLADYLPHTTADVEKLYAELASFASSIQDPWLRKLAAGIIEDPAIAQKLKRAPAAKMMHHAYLGGLLEHVVSLCRLCSLVAGHYGELDADLLLAGAILHDIGKLEELCYERSIGYTTEGQLLGHIVMELETVNRRIDAMAGFPPALKTVVQHLLVSHHGHYEFGSPKLPMIREALVLHYLDDLDSKLGAARDSLVAPGGEDGWSAFSSALGRRMLKLDEYLKPQAGGGSQGELPLGPQGRGGACDEDME
jgi:3'-5' exoribonuclease